MTVLLGIDVGTTIIKAALFNRDGTELAVATQATIVTTPQPGWSETDMETIWQQAASTIRTVLQQSGVDPAEIQGVGVTASMVGIWLVDERGKPLRPAILFNDNRTQGFIEAALQHDPAFLSRIFASSGSVLQPGCTLPLLRWLADHEPDTLAKARHALTARGWLVYRLTGIPIIDPSEASVLPGSAIKCDYDEALFDHFGIAAYRKLLPPLVPAVQIVGGVRADAAALTGLVAGTPVVAGAGDVLATAIGVGAVKPGMAFSILGTAGINGLVMESPRFDPPDVGLTFCLPEAAWVRVMINVAGAPNLDWFAAQITPGRVPDFAALETAAQQSPAGANGIVFLPYLSPTGVFAPFVAAGARGMFYGLTLHHTRQDMLRAVYDGVALSIRDCFEAMPTEYREIRLAGGGARSAFWSQLIADCTGRQVTVLDGTEPGARGAALLAGVAIGWHTSLESAAASLAVFRVHTPRSAESALYHTAYATYRRIRESLLPLWRSMDNGIG